MKRAAAVAAAARAVPGGHPWPDRLRALPSVLRSALRPGPAPGRVGVLAACAGLLYVLSPLDFLPEALLGPFGLGDDLAIAVAAMAFLVRAADRHLDAAPAEIIQGQAHPTRSA